MARCRIGTLDDGSSLVATWRMSPQKGAGRLACAMRPAAHGRDESCLQDPRPASARRVDQLADWSTAPRAFTLEQTPLIRSAVSASGCSQRDPGDRKEPRGKAWSPRNTLQTIARCAQVPFYQRNLIVSILSQDRHGMRSAMASGCYGKVGRAGAPFWAISRMCACTCMARCTH